MIHAKIYNPHVHFKIIEGWWNELGGTHLFDSVIPKLGYVVYDGGIVCAASFVAIDNAKGMCIQLFSIASPSISPKKKIDSLDYLDGVIASLVKDLGYTHIFKISSSKELIKHSKKRGFQELEFGATILVKEL